MVSMGLVVRIPMSTGSLKRIGRIPNFATGMLMDVIAMGTDRWIPRGVWRQSVHFDRDERTSRNRAKRNGTLELRLKWPCGKRCRGVGMFGCHRPIHGTTTDNQHNHRKSNPSFSHTKRLKHSAPPYAPANGVYSTVLNEGHK